ncbi:MAG: mechanosensitive ion channel [Candidatus Methanoplasma sp.]|jgi:small-conductance mechanosensitive channel|nr:mechanosensitive ion channel [Candidatus Methanoplasma sp.]
MMSKGAAIAVALVAVASALLLAVPFGEASGADADGIVASSYGESVSVHAGGVVEFDILVSNILPDDSLGNRRMVTVTAGHIDDVDVTAAEGHFPIDGQDSKTVKVKVAASRYAGSFDGILHIILKVKTVQPNSAETETSTDIHLQVNSELSSDKTFNKILGAFDNPFPEPFNGVLATTVITFILWILIGLIVVEVFMPLFLRMVLFKYKSEEDDLKHEIRRVAPLVLILFAFSKSLWVYGAPDEIVVMLESWFNILYIILGAYIVWRLYTIYMKHVVKSGKDNTERVDLEPILKLFGKLVISVVGVAMIATSLGFNLTVIITSAGIVSLGITLGAQSVLSQFFSGLVILITHPFRSGDYVRIGTNSITYEVRSVNLMNTVFKNWDNEEDIIMPNNSVAAATVTNITAENTLYKIYVYMSVAYGTDLDKAKRIMIDAAMNETLVVKSDSVPMPATRLTSLDASSVTIRLAVFIHDFNDSARVEGLLREKMYLAFLENGISIPFPQLDVHLSREDA